MCKFLKVETHSLNECKMLLKDWKEGRGCVNTAHHAGSLCHYEQLPVRKKEKKWAACHRLKEKFASTWNWFLTHLYLTLRISNSSSPSSPSQKIRMALSRQLPILHFSPFVQPHRSKKQKLDRSGLLMFLGVKYWWFSFFYFLNQTSWCRAMPY